MYVCVCVCVCVCVSIKMHVYKNSLKYMHIQMYHIYSISTNIFHWPYQQASIIKYNNDIDVIHVVYDLMLFEITFMNLH